MIFKQLFEPVSSTYTYLLACETTGQAMLIDPVINAIDRDLQVLQSLQLKLTLTIETHIHADHITSALELKHRVGSRIAAPAIDGIPCVDVGIEEGIPLQLGGIRLDPLHTPGHTDGHFAYRCADPGSDRLFSGDALLIEGCGRTDFQNGDASALYRSVTEKLFTLPEEVLVYPAHDYLLRRVSSIGQEKSRNPRLGQGRTLEEFKAIMADLGLPYPTFINYAVPGNRRCGVCPDDLPLQLRRYCERMSQSQQG